MENDILSSEMKQLKVHFYGDTDGFPATIISPGGCNPPAVMVFSLEDFLYNLHPEDKHVVLSGITALMSGEADVINKPYRRFSSDGRCLWVKCRGQICLNPENGPGYLFLSEIDVTEYENIEKKLRDTVEVIQREHAQAESLRQIAVAISSSLNMGETVDRILEEIKRVIPYDMGSVQLLRRTELEIIGGVGFSNKEEILKMRFPYPQEGSLSTRIVNEQQPLFSNNVAKDFPQFIQADPDKKVCSWMGIPLVHFGEVIGIMALDNLKPGAYRQYHIELAQVIAVHVVIALENARLHEQAYQMAMEDALTKTGSRYRFQMEGRIMFETSRRAKSSIAFIIFDIDFFKKVNDSYGHISGDTVLRMMAKAVAEELRTVDLLARYGGEEFVIILPETDDLAAQTVFTRINHRLSEIEYPGIEEHITVSAGIFSCIPQKSDTLETFISRADEALYMSKNNGRNRITLFNQR